MATKNNTTHLTYISVDHGKKIAVLTMDSPPVNSLSRGTRSGIVDGVNKLVNEPNVMGVIVRGAGQAFCAGAEISEFADGPSAVKLESLAETIQRLENLSIPVVAIVHGYALGGGFEVALACHYRLATNSAKFGLPEVRLGIAPAFISPYVVQRIGFTRARELMLTGRRFNGKEAQAYGIVHLSCPTNELQHCIEVELDEVRQAAPGAIAAVKELLFAVRDKPTSETVAYRAELLNTLRLGDEAQEGLSAFMEKRLAKWVTHD